ncbi:hypothetical protein FKZ61_014125 [Litorilinea aerophila]|uniref:Uncharacterized protein n=1 Tax=Litorilinea aerophila TaxID=1204385 RepID=A0A540VEA1_9CHLR|nr:hypothetical protein [Litorilinea aerophila]MCC9077238.1 hypothetical protein [Litorilinea aerophila]GIV78964.1 MAG: hypothetical protein KatS3mg050_3358 [Litorilinea sp.]
MPTFCIRLEGHLDPDWAAWLGVAQLTHRPDGTTTLKGEVPDQAALFGLLIKIRDLGIPLIGLKRLDESNPPI